MFLPRIAFVFAMLSASSVFADPLSEMDGTWRGSGWAKETPQGPQETLRCQITNTYNIAALTLTLDGQCIVPGRRLAISGRLVGAPDTDRITGRWSNPDGIGRVSITGIQRDDIVAFTFNATDPATGRNVAQNVEWRVSEGTLRLRSSDRSDPNVMMSDVTFTQ